VSRRGLPKDFKLRHDIHYVELLASKVAGSPVGRMIPIEKLTPNPHQPRSDLGDLSDLVASIREKGVLEPLLVRPSDVGGRYMIISGERRYRASLEAGLKEVPCIELDVDDREALEIALIENLQRKDLDPFEEAEGLQALAERFGYTHEQMARRIGKSRTSITEALALAAMPADIRELCRRADIKSKSTLLQIVRQGDPEKMRRLLEQIKSGGLTRDEARRARRAARRPAGHTFRHSAPAYTVTVKFRKSQVSKAEIRAALKDALSSLGD
jgi:ParB family chromosome partitioning protein